MSEIKTVRSWREILKDVCATPQQKKAVAEQLGHLTVRTIDRWISGQSNPQKTEAIRGLALLSEEMLESLQQEFPEAFLPKQAVLPFEQMTLPAEFYRRVVQACAWVPASKRRWTIWHLVANQMVPHLDPERRGLLVIYTRIRSTQVQFEEGAGDLVWTARQIEAPPSQVDQWLVQAMLADRPFFINSCADAHISPPVCLIKHELIQSIGYFPLFRAGVADGGLLFCSTQEDFFSALRQSLIEQYADLFALMLDDPGSAFQKE
ncbi:MAG TPA: GAF domain-containing protein [Ktedonobacteraceae bacterium]|nr:GAF domain-containing protein [Ktedonobacteraceae bacterium]